MVGLAIALASGLSAMGAIAKNKAPELAVSVQPVNGFAFETLASNSIEAAVVANKGEFPNRINQDAETFARQAFMSEPVTPAAIAVLALGSTEGKKREFMQQALALTRRQQLVIGWMIVDAGTREDIPAILGHYDTMLRTSYSAASVVIPTMAGALANTNFVEPFADLLATKPPWASQFWGAVVVTPEAIKNAAELRERLYTDNEEKESYRDARLINALVNNKRFEDAENLYQLLAGQRKESSLLKNGSFEREPEYPPLDWQLFSNGEYGAAITGGNLQLSAIPNSGGLFARKLIAMPATIIQLDIKSSAEIPDWAVLSIDLKCAETFATVPLPISIKIKDRSIVRRIDNRGSECRYYWLNVTGRALDEEFDVSINSIALKTQIG